MELAEILTKDSIIIGLNVSSKKQAIEVLSKGACEITGIPKTEIFDILLQRERLGSTGVGHGVAIPHGKIKKLDKIYGMIAVLKSPIEFESVDDEMVDLMFLLLAPEDAGADHLKVLAKVSRLLRDQGLTNKLRKMGSKDEVISFFKSNETSNAA